MVTCMDKLVTWYKKAIVPMRFVHDYDRQIAW